MLQGLSCLISSLTANPAFTENFEKSPLVITTFLVMMFFVMSNIVTICRALSDETRWRIVRLVMERALCVCELADILEMPQSSVSSHVQIIRKAGLLESETCGKWTYFRIQSRFLPLLRGLIRGFPDDPSNDADEARAVTRMTLRATSCCPGPVRLARPRRAPTSARV